MGSVFRPKDFRSGYKKVIDNSLKDLRPDTKDDVFKLLNEWEGQTSKEKLMKIIGAERMKILINEIKNLDDLTENEKEDLKNIFKDSLTFD
ncbi:MAG TPA: hypothetical protein VFK40_00260 [Nitrososphaeraceae archaeon]|nr:hypothetical protein [Nitrososphaeraceae archaeon]HET8792347.1 hypothetical protein [Nitrososphaeraceae archaeon]